MNLEKFLQDEDETDGRARAVPLSRNPSVTLHQVDYRGCRVPYIELFKVPVDEHGEQVYPLVNRPGGEMVVYSHPGPWRWSITLDKRLSWDFGSEVEAVRAAEMMADAMAIATGWACHGATTRLNRHGPTTQETPLGPPPSTSSAEA